MARTRSDEDRYDAIVVGIGGVGSAAGYRLARRGLDVLGIERHDVPHTMGSSHGGTRIIRRAQHEGPEYVPLVERAYGLWRDLDDRTGRDLLTVTGSIYAGAPGTDVTAAGADVNTADVDAVVTAVKTPSMDVDADVRAPVDLGRRLLYAVSPETGNAICNSFLDVPVRSPEYDDPNGTLRAALPARHVPAA